MPSGSPSGMCIICQALRLQIVRYLCVTFLNDVMQGGAGQGYGNPGIPVSQNLTQAFPPMAPEDVQRYQALFASLDTDRDGYVKVG